MANKSIGDFYVNIMPKFDEKNVKKGSMSLGKMSSGVGILTTGVVDAGAGVFNFTWRVAESNLELQRSARLLGQTESQLQKNRDMFELAGGEAKSYDDTVKGIMKTIQGAKFGQADFQTLGLAGVDIAAFKDPVKGLDAMRSAFSRMNTEQRLFFGERLGLSEDALLVITQTNKQWFENNKLASKRMKLSKGEQKNLRELVIANRQLNQTFDQTKKELAAKLAPGQARLSRTFTEMLEDPEIKSSIENLAQTITMLTGIIIKNIDIVTDLIFALKATQIAGKVGGALGLLGGAKGVAASAAAGVTAGAGLGVTLALSPIGAIAISRGLTEIKNKKLKEKYKDLSTDEVLKKAGLSNLSNLSGIDRRMTHSINNNITVNVNGNGDPLEIKTHVSDAMNNVMRDTIKNQSKQGGHI